MTAVELAWEFGGRVEIPSKTEVIGHLTSDWGKDTQADQGQLRLEQLDIDVTDTGMRSVGEVSTVTRFGPKVGQIGPKWDNSGKFSDQIQYILARCAKMY